MVEIEIPVDPAPNGYIPNPYEKELTEAYQYVKQETDSTEGWSSIGKHPPCFTRHHITMAR